MKKILPALIILIGLVVGGGVGLLLRPTPGEPIECNETSHKADCVLTEETTPHEKVEPAPEDVYYVRLSKQFVVPVVDDNKVVSLVVMSLSIETTPIMSDVVFAREPKLRDALLAVMFLHANSGGFDGQFTGGEAIRDLRDSLLEAAVGVIGTDVFNVLITDILRQDV